MTAAPCTLCVRPHSPDERTWTDEKPARYCPYGFGELFKSGNKMSMANQSKDILMPNNVPWEDIITGMTAGKTKSETPKVLITMGGNAAGKTTALTSMDSDISNFVFAGLDGVLEQLPDYKHAVESIPTYKNAAKDCYPLAMLVLEQLYAKVQKEKLNVILEFTGRSWAKKAVPLLKGNGLQGVSKDGPFFTPASGYTSFQTVFVDSPFQNAVENADKRAMASGRFVPAEVVKESYDGLHVAFDEAKDLAAHEDKAVSIQVSHCVDWQPCCELNTDANAATPRPRILGFRIPNWIPLGSKKSERKTCGTWKNTEPSEALDGF